MVITIEYNHCGSLVGMDWEYLARSLTETIQSFSWCFVISYFPFVVLLHFIFDAFLLEALPSLAWDIYSIKTDFDSSRIFYAWWFSAKMQQFAKVPILQSFSLKLLNSTFEDQVRIMHRKQGTDIRMGIFYFISDGSCLWTIKWLHGTILMREKYFYDRGSFDKTLKHNLRHQTWKHSAVRISPDDVKLCRLICTFILRTAKEWLLSLRIQLKTMFCVSSTSTS